MVCIKQNFNAAQVLHTRRGQTKIFDTLMNSFHRKGVIGPNHCEYGKENPIFAKRCGRCGYPIVTSAWRTNYHRARPKPWQKKSPMRSHKQDQGACAETQPPFTGTNIKLYGQVHKLSLCTGLPCIPVFLQRPTP